MSFTTSKSTRQVTLGGFFSPESFAKLESIKFQSTMVSSLVSKQFRSSSDIVKRTTGYLPQEYLSQPSAVLKLPDMKLENNDCIFFNVAISNE